MEQGAVIEEKCKPVPVIGKISTMFECVVVEGNSNKAGRDVKFLATNKLCDIFDNALKSAVRFRVTGKVDGTCCIIMKGKFMKRRDMKIGRKIPTDWVETSPPDKKGHRIGFMPVNLTNKEDKWFKEALVITDKTVMIKVLIIENGVTIIKNIPLENLEGQTVEFVGPKIQGDPHKIGVHCVIPHGIFELDGFPQDFNFDEFVTWFKTNKKTKFFEGVVIHFEDGQLFKIHRHHLDIPWNPENSLFGTVF